MVKKFKVLQKTKFIELFYSEIPDNIIKENISIEYEDSDFGDRRWIVSNNLFIEMPELIECEILGIVEKINTNIYINFDCQGIIKNDKCSDSLECINNSIEICCKDGCQRAKQALIRLLTSKGCDLTKKHVIIKSKI